jgi:tRNA-splicing ligase RtcB
MVMRVIEGDDTHAPVLLWSTAASRDTVQQLRALAAQRYIVGHVAAMADAHVSEGVSVGTVFATRCELVPDALGDDLGCGVYAARLSASASQVDSVTLERALALWSRRIPAGREVHRVGASLSDSLASVELSTRELTRRWSTLAPRHLATLGGGNHFLELDRSPDGSLWLLVHSGSRGVGGAIAEHHRRVALARETGALAALDLREPSGAAFFDDLQRALAFAVANRRALAERALECLSTAIGERVAVEEDFDVPHNTVRDERHDGERLLVHRKGAVRAELDERVVIPGSMGTASYVARGLGHDPAWRSCSHGAGRVMTRKEARVRVRPNALLARMGRVVFDRTRARDLVEESPDVYRDIRAVIDEQRELVAPLVRLEPLLSFKG